MNPDDLKLIEFKEKVSRADNMPLLSSYESYVAIPRAVRSRLEEEAIEILREEILKRMDNEIL